MTDDDKFVRAVREQLDRHFAELRQIFSEGFDRCDRKIDRIGADLKEIERIFDRIEAQEKVTKP
jgi:hypothetical protein